MSAIEGSSTCHDEPTLGLGASYLMAGIFIFSFQDIAIKQLSGDFPVHQIVFIRSLGALPLILLLVYGLQGFDGFKTKRGWLELLRAVLMFGSYTSYYMALALLPLADAVALFFTGPIFMTILSRPVLGERVSLQQWAAVLVGFAGVLLVAGAGAGMLSAGALLALGSAFAYGSSQIITRQLGSTDSSATMTLCATLFYLVASGVLGFWLGEGQLLGAAPSSLVSMTSPWSWPSAYEFWVMLGLGAISTAGFYLLSRAYVVAPPRAIAPIEYTALIWGILWGYVFFSETPNLVKVAGMALIVGAGVFILMRHARPSPVPRVRT